ncbi:ubiquitin carboxyl-terminal hydrolase 12-like protein isoform X2 [Tanacetum coccineum]
MVRLNAFLHDALPIEEMNPAEVHCEMADVVIAGVMERLNMRIRPFVRKDLLQTIVCRVALCEGYWKANRDILEMLNEMAGFAPDEEIKLFGEFRSGFGVQCLRVDKTLTFLVNKLQDGDVICFQKHLKVENTETCSCPDV